MLRLKWVFSVGILLSKTALHLKFWHLYIQEGDLVGWCAIESTDRHKMMHVLEWRARSNDSVVDVTPGVELWHTLWFMWESPRCPEHKFFTTLSDNCALFYHFGDGTTSWSLLEIYFTLSELDDELQITCQWSAQAKIPLMYHTYKYFASFGIISSEATNWSSA